MASCFANRSTVGLVTEVVYAASEDGDVSRDQSASLSTSNQLMMEISGLALANANMSRGRLRNFALDDFKIRSRFRHQHYFHLCH